MDNKEITKSSHRYEPAHHGRKIVQRTIGQKVSRVRDGNGSKIRKQCTLYGTFLKRKNK